MSVIIRLQGLPLSAAAADVRSFFSGLRIPDGAVHIVGGENGDAFIGFATDEDARQAMALNGGTIHNSKVSLLLSSRAEMTSVITAARAGIPIPSTSRYEPPPFLQPKPSPTEWPPNHIQQHDPPRYIPPPLPQKRDDKELDDQKKDQNGHHLKEESWKTGGWDRREKETHAIPPPIRPFEHPPHLNVPPLPFPLPFRMPPTLPPKQEEEVFVECSRLPPDLLRPLALEKFLSPTIPLTLSSLKVVYGPEGFHMYSLVRFPSAMDAFNALKKDGEMGIRIRASTKEMFDKAVDGPPPVVVANGGSRSPPRGSRSPPRGSRSPPRGSKRPRDRERERDSKPRRDDPRREFGRDRERGDRDRRDRRVRERSPDRRRRRSHSPDKINIHAYYIELRNCPYRVTENDIRQYVRLPASLVQKAHTDDGSPSDRWILRVETAAACEEVLTKRGQIDDRIIRSRRMGVLDAERALSVKEKRPPMEKITSLIDMPPPPPDFGAKSFGAFSGPVFTERKNLLSLPPMRGRGGFRGGLLQAPPLMGGPPMEIAPPPFAPRGRGGGMFRGGRRGGGPMPPIAPRPLSCVVLSNLPSSATPLSVARFLRLPEDFPQKIYVFPEGISLIDMINHQNASEATLHSREQMDGQMIIVTPIPFHKYQDELAKRNCLLTDGDVAREVGPPGCVITCDGFPPNLSLEEVLSFFEGYPVIESSVRMRMDEEGVPTGECMLAMAEEGAIARALASLNGRSLRGHSVHLNIA